MVLTLNVYCPQLSLPPPPVFRPVFMQGLEKNYATPEHQTKPSANKLGTHGTRQSLQHTGRIFMQAIDRDQIQDSTP
jgi:hypothetical protein